MKKICFFNACKIWGGGEKWHYEVALKLSEDSDYRVMICTYPQSPLFHKVKDSIRVKTFKVNNLSFLNPWQMIRLCNYFKKNKIETVIMNLSSDLKAAGIAAKFAGVKNIVYRRGSAIPIKNTMANRLLFKHVPDRIIANSNYTKQTILQNNKELFPEDKIEVIYNGINAQQFMSKDYEILYPRPSGQLILGNAGRLSHQKGQRYLIDIACELKKRAIDFKILIAGTGELESDLKKYAKEKTVEDCVIFLGFVENIKSFMKTIDIFVLTSIWEGFGYVMVEAMLAAKPVIAFDTSNNCEIIKHGITGDLVEFEDIQLFCDKIEEKILNPDLIRQLGIQGEERVQRKFTLDKCVSRLKQKILCA